MTWQTARYPVTLRCGFCGREVTVRLKDDGPATITVAHAPWCVLHPERGAAT